MLIRGLPAALQENVAEPWIIGGPALPMGLAVNGGVGAAGEAGVAEQVIDTVDVTLGAALGEEQLM